MKNRPFFSLAILTAGAIVAWAQAPTGTEFPVNSTTTGKQQNPAVAAAKKGNSVVVWESDGQDGSGLGIIGRRFNASGNPLGEEFQVNSFTSGRQSKPSVATDTAGNFVVVWESLGQDGSSDGIFGRRFNVSGNPVGEEFQVNSSSPGAQVSPAVASDGPGNFVVVWQSSDGNATGIFGRRFTRSGAPVGGEFLVNTRTPGAQKFPSVASSVSGDFVVVWQSKGSDGNKNGVAGRLYSSSGSPASGEFQVNSFTRNNQSRPSVASDRSGNFVVVWQSKGQNGSKEGIFGQVFDASGTSKGAELQVNNETASNQKTPSVAADKKGNFFVVWESQGRGIFGRRFKRSGSSTGSEFQVNQSRGNLKVPDVAADAKNKFVIVWQGQDGGGDGIKGRR